MKIKQLMLAAALVCSLGYGVVGPVHAQEGANSPARRTHDDELNRERDEEVSTVHTERGRRGGDDREGSGSRNRDSADFDSSNRTVRVREVPDREQVPMRRQAVSDSNSDELEFQAFVNRNYGKWLPVFGRDAFNGIDQGFDAPVNSTPSDGYEVGPGDEIRVKINGFTEMNANLVVDNTGFITLPRVGPIQVNGVARRDLQAVIGRAISKLYKNYTLHVYTGTLRTISIFVVGHAGRPGAYRVPASSSLINALYAAGGVSPTGSLRAVKLLRGGQQTSAFDFYDFVAKGSTVGDVQLRNGDVIHVPAAQARVALLGAANVQAIFEIAAGGTSLENLLEVAGGLPSASRYENVTVDRLDKEHPEAPKQVVTLDLRVAADAKFVLRDGDVVMLNALGSKYANMVSVRGNVFQPIRRPFQPGIHVSDLIPNAAVLYSQDTVRAQNDLALGIDTEPNSSGTGYRAKYGQSMKRRKSEKLVPSDNINWNLATIERKNPLTAQTELVHFNLARAINNPKGPDDIELRAGDQVVVYGDRNLVLPEQLRNRFIRIEGEVTAAGDYQLQEGETLRQMIERAGGITSRGFLYGMKLKRQSQLEAQKEQLAKASASLDDAIASQMNAALASGLSAEDKTSSDTMVNEMRRRAEALKRAQPDGRITLDLAFNAQPADLPEVQLEDGDVVMLPVKPQHLTIAGAVQNPITTIWSSTESFEDYVNSAVPKKTADLSEIYVIRANGRAEIVKKSFLFGFRAKGKPQPGDVIYVPEQTVGLGSSTSFLRGIRDWSMVLVQLLIGASVAKNL